MLWDCISLVTDEAVAEVKKRGGLAAIAISHPHYYTAMVEWSDAFGGVPIYLHEAERQWVQRPAPAIRFWSGETHALNDADDAGPLRRPFSRRPGAPLGRGDGRHGALFTGDILMVTLDRRWVSFMYSFPNYIPLNRAAVERIAAALEPFAYDAIFGAWWNRICRVRRQGGGRPLGRALPRGDRRLSRHSPAIRPAYSLGRGKTLKERRGPGRRGAGIIG